MQNHVMRLTQAARGRVRHGGTGASHHIVTVSRGVEAPVQSRKMVLVREDLIIDSLRAPPAQTHRLLVQNQLTALMPAVDMMAMPPKLRSGVACCWTSLLELLRLLPSATNGPDRHVQLLTSRTIESQTPFGWSKQSPQWGGPTHEE